MEPNKDLVILSLSNQLANANMIMANQEAIIRELQQELEDGRENQIKEMDEEPTQSE